jgi:hypothetical protein
VRALKDGAASPVFVVDEVTFGEVALEVFGDACGGSFVACGEIDFVVQTEGAVIEVGRADDAPKVGDDERLGGIVG